MKCKLCQSEAGRSYFKFRNLPGTIVLCPECSQKEPQPSAFPPERTQWDHVKDALKVGFLAFIAALLGHRQGK